MNIKNDMTLGAKIKEARISQQLTQSELVGDFITRNMLSKIENDAATPSLKTLEYLAFKLDMPLSYFMSSMVSSPEELNPDDIDLAASPFCKLVKSLEEKPLAERSEAERAQAEDYFTEHITRALPAFEACRRFAEYYMASEKSDERKKSLPYVDLLCGACAFSSDAVTVTELLYWKAAAAAVAGDNAAAIEFLRGAEQSALQCKSRGAYGDENPDVILVKIYTLAERCSVDEGNYKAAYEYAHKKTSIKLD